MEPESDRFFRQSVPGLWPRFALFAFGGYGATYLHARVRDRIVEMLPNSFTHLYLTGTSTMLITLTFLGFMGLIVCYYYHLRDRRLHTAMTEAGLAARTIVAGLLVLAGFVFELFLNDGGFGG